MTHIKSKKHILLAASMTSALITLSATQEAMANTRYYAAPIGQPGVELNLDVLDSVDNTTAPANTAPIRLNPNYASSSAPAPVSEPAHSRETITLRPTRAMLEKQRQADENARQAVLTEPKPRPETMASPSSPISLATETPRDSATANIEQEKITAPKVSTRSRRSTTFTSADAPGIADVKIMAPRSLPPLEQANRTSELPSAAPSRPAYEPRPIVSSPVEMPEIETVEASPSYEPAPEPVSQPVSQPVPESRPAPINNPAYEMPPIEEVSIPADHVTPTQPVTTSRPSMRPASQPKAPRPSFFDVIERSVDRLAGDVKSNAPYSADAQASYTPEQGYAPIPNAELFDPRKKPEDSPADTKALTEAAIRTHEAKPTAAPAVQRAETAPAQKNPNIMVEVTQPAADDDWNMAPVEKSAPQNIQPQPSPQLPKIETVSEPMLPRRAVNAREREDRYADDSTTMNIDNYQSHSPAPSAVSTPTPPPVSSDQDVLPIINKEVRTKTETETVTQATNSAPHIKWNEAPTFGKPIAFKIDRSEETAAAPLDPAFDPFENAKTPPPVRKKPDVIQPRKDAPQAVTAQHQAEADANNRIEPAARTLASIRQPAPRDTNTAETNSPSLNQNPSLIFEGANSDLKPELQKDLDSMIAELEADDSRRLQLRSYAASTDGSSSSARRVALGRAIKVRKYFMDQGIRPTRIDVRALGDETEQTPLNRVDMVLVQ